MNNNKDSGCEIAFKQDQSIFASNGLIFHDGVRYFASLNGERISDLNKVDVSVATMPRQHLIKVFNRS